MKNLVTAGHIFMIFSCVKGDCKCAKFRVKNKKAGTSIFCKNELDALRMEWQIKLRRVSKNKAGKRSENETNYHTIWPHAVKKKDRLQVTAHLNIMSVCLQICADLSCSKTMENIFLLCNFICFDSQ